MNEFVPLLGWLLAGFLGGVHCLGMCGGLAAAIALNNDRARQAKLLLAANIGRIGSYALIGAALGGLGGVTAWLPRAAQLQFGLYFISQVLLIMLGLYLAGFSALSGRLEHLGAPVWRRLQPRFKRLLPLRHSGHALMAGALWGWLPCGLVYTAGMAALASHSAVRGALTLLAFGAGTLPNLMAMGLAAQQLNRLRRSRLVRQVAGLTLCVVAVIQLMNWWGRN